MPGEGTPIASRPSPMTMPKAVFTASCDRKYLLSRWPASSSARVVRWRSFDPNRRMKRSRRSSRCISTKIATMRTMIVVSSGPRIGASTVRASVKGEVSFWITRTGTARASSPDPGEDWTIVVVVVVVGAAGVETGGLRLIANCLVIAASLRTVKLWTFSTLASIVRAYCGALAVSAAAWLPISVPTIARRARAASTVRITAGARQMRKRWRKFTTGDSTNDSITASVIGISTLRAK
jgi:hypothetical protein